MFKKYGVLGTILIIFVELNFFYKFYDLGNLYFPLIWLGYILLIDSLVYKLKKDSLIMKRPNQILGFLFLSAVFWWMFELINLRANNWTYRGGRIFSLHILIKTLSFGTVLPAFFETVELIRSFKLFEKKKLHKKYKITKTFIHTMIIIGSLFLALSAIFPRYFYPLVWLTFFLILDPINYINKQPSVIGHLKDRKLAIPLSLLLAGIIMGILWEFWNFYATTKWYYDIPFLGFFKIFEMPILGYLGYFPFSFELYSMYWFVRSLFIHKEPLLVK